ncbi:uncharacterized protein LOC111831073 [Capsella rubella]|uniref:uncharacterized protein LOC111831073 n=1 Tax=Capsella rubella TaxID=81985 RepID=UPI000CD4A8CD|nr:uncharacterized protein LOC111831073 [Capsella rubella]
MFEHGDKRKQEIFRYDRRLKDNEEVKRLVAEIWTEDERMDIQRSLSNVRRAIIDWNREKQQNSMILIDKKKEELEKAMLQRIWRRKLTGNNEAGNCGYNWGIETQDGGLGFKDVTAFNEALLAKQSWRVLTEPAGLLAIVLQGKYCQVDEYLEVKCHVAASHGWRSILIGRDLLKKQLGWAIGNGKSVKAWTDPWQGTVEWDQTKVSRYFPAHKEVIMALKPSRLGASDRRFWLPSADGNYSTKTGYHVPRNDLLPQPSDTQVGECNWLEEVWNVKVSPKLQNFLWKALAGALPTGLQLASRSMPLDPSCIRCRDPESICHMLFNCPFVKKIWALAPRSGTASIPNFLDVQQGLIWLRKKTTLPPTGLGKGPLYPWICWNIWLSRNQKMFNNIVFSEEETLLKAIQNAKEWQHAQSLEATPRSIPRLLLSQTTEEETGSSTVHTDAAWDHQSKRAGVGWIFSSPSLGNFSRHSSCSEFVSSTLLAECIAIRSALLRALDFGLLSLTLKIDCQILSKAISSRTLLVEAHGVLSDIFIPIPTFISFNYKFIPRAANTLADSLSKSCLAQVVNS